MIFFKQDALIYLKRQGLEVYLYGKDPLNFVFPLDLVSAEEIRDPEKLRERLFDFLDIKGLTKLKAVIVLAEELIFQSNLSQKEKFLEELPFPLEKIVSKAYLDKNLVLAVNGELFMLLIEEITKTGGKVSFVVPQTLLEATTINTENSQEILADKKLLETANLLEKSGEKQNFNLKLPLIFLLVCLLSGGGFFFLKFLEKPVKETVIKPAVQKTSSPTESPVVNQKTKKELTIKILNGTGTPGDAGLVKKAFEALEYQNMETDNLEVQDATASAIIFSAQADSYVPEISVALQAIFELEPLSVSTDSAFFDLQIITGK